VSEAECGEMNEKRERNPYRFERVWAKLKLDMPKESLHIKLCPTMPPYMSTFRISASATKSNRN
jgi:hypothetical protein